MNKRGSRKTAKPEQQLFLPRRIVSGGQTGVDRAGLDVAIALGIEHGGWCPAGRLSEDGSIPSRYELQETESRDYRVRTEQNVIDSDATLILHSGNVTGGTRLTRRLCQTHSRPFLCVDIFRESSTQVQVWLLETRPSMLNVAGPRASTSPEIYEAAMKYLLAVFSPSAMS